jgi:small-conductance mechanosensitive channel
MISSASSKYFEGLLFILVRRPYQIGDAIHVSNVEADTSYNGSAWWTVEDVNLFTTKVVFLYTMERASLSNGSLANSRIINSSESTEAYLWTTLKFPIDVTFDKLQIFQRALEEFIKNRPREFLSYLDFRVMQVEVDKGSLSYLLGAQHRSTWAEWTTIMLSKADLILFSVELQKKLGIYYKTPPLPVDLSMGSLQAVQRAQQEGLTVTPADMATGGIPNEMLSSPDISGLQALFPPRTPHHQG